MISIISAFYNQSIQDDLSREIEGQDMTFLCPDCANAVTLTMAVESNPNVDVIFLRLAQIRNTEAQLAQIRDISKTARIVLIISGLRKQYVPTQYEGYCKRYNIEDIIFEGKGLDKFEILSILSKGRLTVEQEAAEEKKSVKENTEISKEKPPIKETVQELEREPEVNPVVKAEKRKIKPDKPKSDKIKPPVINIKRRKREVFSHNSTGRCLVISIFGTTRGAGVTNMTASMAEYLSMNGKRVAAFNLSGGDEFQYIKGRAEYRDVKSVNLSDFEKEYDIILCDLGTPYNISSGGIFNGYSHDYDYRNIELLKKSSLKIIMSLSDAWHIKKCEYFLNDEKWTEQISNSYIFLFDTEPPKSLQKYAVNKFDRNSQSFANEIARLFL